MLCHQYYTKDYEHEYLFTFKNKKYLVYSIVKLTKQGKMYLETTKDNVILTEHFINLDGKECWTYNVGWSHAINKPLYVSTDKHPNQLIDEIVVPANIDYTERELFGTQAASYSNGIKNTPKDWEIPEMRKAWIYLIMIFIGVSIFKDWYVKLIIRIVSTWFFITYRSTYINVYTTYTHEEDAEMLKKKFEILYGVKFNKEGK